MASSSIPFNIGISKNRVAVSNDKLRKKEAKLFLERSLPYIQTKYKLTFKLLTCVYNPHNTSLEDAWRQIFQNVLAIKQVLTTPEYNCQFALLTIETHTSKKSKKKETAPGGEESLETEDLISKTKEIGKKDKTSISDTSSIPNQSEELDETPKKGTLNGYPHIHVAIAVNAPKGKIVKSNILAMDIYRNTTFGDDIKVDDYTTKKKKSRGKPSSTPKDDVAIISYCLKDSCHLSTYENLYKYLSEDTSIPENITSQSTANNTILFNICQDPEITRFFNEINDKGCIISLPNNSSSEDDSFHPELKTTSNTLIADTKNKFSVTLTMLVNYMMENNLKKYNDDVFTLKKGTRRTWEKWGSMEDVYGKLCTLENEEYLSDILSNKSKVLDLASMKTQSIIPTLTIDWNFIEFEDFYFHLSSFSILLGELPPNKQLAMHIPSFTLRDLKNGMEDESLMTPDFWLTIIRNQDFSKNEDSLKEFFVRYYKTLMPLIQKDRVLALYGVPDSGKTSAIEPLSRIMPKFAISQFSSGQFKYSHLFDKRLVIADDTKSKILDELDALNILEGNKTIVADRKHKDAVPFTYPGNAVICTNSFPESWLDDDIYDEYSQSLKTPSKEMINYIAKGVKKYELKPEYAARLAIYIFSNKIPKRQPGIMKTITDKEIAKVIFFTGFYYSSEYLQHNLPPHNRPLLLISDDYDSEYQEICENAERIFGRSD